MKTLIQNSHMALLALLLAGASGVTLAAGVAVTLTGDQESPPVQTTATGKGMITVGADKSVSGSVTTSGISATMAHIHEGAVGVNGNPIIPLVKAGDNQWSVQAGAKLTDQQYLEYKAGDLYVNVHSAAHPGGEIRAQIKP